MVIDSRDLSASKHIKLVGFYPGIQNYIRLVKEGDIVLNIGVHIGLEAMIMGKIIGPTGKIYMFEPYQISRNILIKNIYINDLDNISTVYPVAASNRKMTGFLVVELLNTGASNVETDQTYQDKIQQKIINESNVDELR